MNESIWRGLGRYLLTLLIFAQVSQKSAGAIPSETQAPPVVKAWGILFHVMDRLQEYVDTQALSLIHNDDILASSAISILLNENTKGTPSPNDEVGAALLGFSRQVAALHAAGEVFDQLGSEAELRKLVGLFSDLQKFYS